MSFLDRLLGRASASSEATAKTGDTETVRRIARELADLPPDRARFLAAFAYVLGRVAHADLTISEAESRSMEGILQRVGALPQAEAVLAVEIAKSQNRLFGGTEGFLVTRELREIVTLEQREQVLDCLFEVSAAEGAISATEENLIRQVASELGVDHPEYIAIRSRWSQQRAVLRKAE